MDQLTLISECINNSRKAQRQLFDMYYTSMMRICMRYTYNRNDAESIVVEGFLEVFNNLKSYKGSGDLFYWIRTIMLRKCMKQLRFKYQSKESLQSFDTNEFEYLSDDSANIIQELSSQDILNYIQKLPDMEKCVFNLYVLEDFSHNEISKELQIAESTSRWYLMKAKSILKEIILQNEKVVNNYEK